MATLPGAHLLTRAALCVLLGSATGHAHAQEPERADSLRPGRAWVVAGGIGAFTTCSLIALDKAWYSGHDRGRFHLFNDGDEWLQMDKYGHAYGAYQLGRGGHAAFRWAGFNPKLSTWLGGSVGLLYLTGVELLDGRSSEYGFSWWDMAANTAGTALFIGQETALGEQRLLLKWSAHLTHYAPQRPNVLGSTFAERLLKDYNGTTIWLSANPNAFGWKALPPWLNVAAGLGAEGMLKANDHPGAYRQFYLAPDIAFSRIPTESKFLRTAFFLLDALKLPAPALEFKGNGGVKGWWVYW